MNAQKYCIIVTRNANKEFYSWKNFLLFKSTQYTQPEICFMLNASKKEWKKKCRKCRKLEMKCNKKKEEREEKKWEKYGDWFQPQKTSFINTKYSRQSKIHHSESATFLPLLFLYLYETQIQSLVATAATAFAMYSYYYYYYYIFKYTQVHRWEVVFQMFLNIQIEFKEVEKKTHTQNYAFVHVHNTDHKNEREINVKNDLAFVPLDSTTYVLWFSRCSRRKMLTKKTYTHTQQQIKCIKARQKKKEAIWLFANVRFYMRFEYTNKEYKNK